MRVCRRVIIQHFLILHKVTQYFAPRRVLLNMTRYYTICFNITYGDLISCSSGPLDGQNRLKIYWKDLIDSASCQLNDLAFAGKLYLQFEQQDDGFGNRIFEKANAGLVFESFQMLDMNVHPL